MKKINQLVILSLVAFAFTAKATETTSVGFVNSNPVSILKVTKVEVLKTVVGEDSPINSYVLVNFEGSYESSGEDKNLVARIEQGTGSRTYWPRLELKLYSADLSGKPVRVERPGYAAVSIPKPFKVTVKFQPMSWSGKNIFFDARQRAKYWSLSLGEKHYAPVPHTKFYGITVGLIHTEEKRAFNTYVYGFKK